MGKTNKASTHREASEDRGNVSFPYATSMSTWTRVQPRGRIPELEDGGTEEGWAMRKGGEAPLGVCDAQGRDSRAGPPTSDGPH